MGRRATKQLGFELKYRGRGGYRPGAGRPKKPGAGVPHVRRPALAARHPVHVTARVCDEAARLRTRACFAVVASCIGNGCERKSFRVTHFSVQSNHLHLIVEADDAVALARGIKGLSVRIAKAVNRILERRGRVFADRYHAHQLRSPTEVANAIAYVLENKMIHAARLGRRGEADAVDLLTSYGHRQLVAQPRTWLLRIGWTLGLPGP
ncbi:MAG: transposase [Myxococcales bacterium]